MSALWAAFLGFVQGVAEFLPISSSGHLSVLQNLLGLDAGEGHLLFDVLLHLATFFAVCLAYRRDLGKMLGDSLDYFRGTGAWEGRRKGRLPAATRLVLLLIVATLPLFLILPFHSRIEALYYNSFFIGIMFLLTAGCSTRRTICPRAPKKRGPRALRTPSSWVSARRWPPFPASPGAAPLSAPAWPWVWSGALR